MSLTFPAAYSAALKSSSVQENWYVKLYYGDESSFLGLSDVDLDVSTDHYFGVVEHWGDIAEEIDLTESKAAISETSISCANFHKNLELSAELYGGTNKYLNRKVEIFSYINSESVQIFLGKFANVSVDNNTVTITIEAVSPWDGITIPTARNTDNFLEPLAYGDYARTAIEEDDKASFARPIDSKLYPVPFNIKTVYSQHIWHMLTPRAVIGGYSNLHYYERELNKLPRIVNPANPTTSTELNGATSVYYHRDLDRTFLLRADGEYGTSTFGDGTVENAHDWEADGFTDGTDEESSNTEHNGSGPPDNQTVENMSLSMPKISGTVTALKIYYKVRINCTAQTTTGDYQTLTVTDETWGKGTEILKWDELMGTGTIDTNDEGSGDGINDDYKEVVHTAELGANGDTIPEYINIKCDWLATFNGGSSDEFTAKVEIYDVYALITIGLDWTAQDFDALTNLIDGNQFMYVCTDGEDKSYSGGSGTATLPHEIHRDLLARYTDFDYADGSFPDWADIGTARAGWTMRWWLLEQKELKEVLEQIQFEGCFIFKPRIDGSGGRYIWIDGTDPSGDVVHTLDEEHYDNLSFELTDTSELMTDGTYNYQRHPAKNEYLQTANYANTTARTNWFKSVTNENKLTFDLDFLVNCGDNTDSIYDTDSTDSDNLPNETIVMYYDNIRANPRLRVGCDIKDKSKWNLEVGDIIKFNDTNRKPYGKTWANLYFAVINTYRNKNVLNIMTREVYES